MNHDAPTPDSTSGRKPAPKCSPPLDVRSTVSDPSGLDPTTNLPYPSTVNRNTPTPVPINRPIESTEEFNNVFNNNIDAIP